MGKTCKCPICGQDVDVLEMVRNDELPQGGCCDKCYNAMREEEEYKIKSEAK